MLLARENALSVNLLVTLSHQSQMSSQSSYVFRKLTQREATLQTSDNIFRERAFKCILILLKINEVTSLQKNLKEFFLLFLKND